MRIIVPGIVLAAGRSSRMGQAKSLLPTGISGETFISRIVRALGAGGVQDVLIVVAEEESDMVAALAGAGVSTRTVVNPTPELGQISSLRAGLRAIDRPGVAGVLVTLVDVPLITAGLVRLLLDVHSRTRAPVVRPIRHGRHGHPVIFDRAVFEELHSASLDNGAKAVVQAHTAEVENVSIEDEGPFLDIDTPTEYKRIFNRTIPVNKEIPRKGS